MEALTGPSIVLVGSTAAYPSKVASFQPQYSAEIGSATKPALSKLHAESELALHRRQRVFAALDPVVTVLNLKNGVDDFALADMVKHCLKEFLLSSWHHVGNDDDEACMHRSTIVEREKVCPVIGHKGVVALQNRIHQPPILRSSEPEIGNMICRMTGGMGQLDRGSVQTLVNEEFCQDQAAEDAVG